MTTSRPGLHLPVDLDHDPVAQVVGHQGLLGLGQAQLPRDAGVLLGGERRGAGAPVVAGDEHHVRMGLGHPGGHRADPHLGHQLHVDPGRRVGRLQVVDELGDVLDGVDVVVRRRRDEARPPASRTGSWRSTGRPCDPGSWPPSPGLAPWAILIWMSSALTRYSEVTPKRPEATCLMALRREVAVGVGGEAVGVLAALAGVGLAARVGSWRWPGSRGPRPRSIRRTWRRSRTGPRWPTTGSTSSIGTGGSWPVRSVISPRRVASAVGLVVDRLGVLLEDLVALGPGGVLELEDGARVEEVDLPLAPPLVLAADLALAVGPLGRAVEVGQAVAAGDLAGQDVEARRRRSATRCRRSTRRPPREPARPPRRPGRRCRRPRSRCPSWTSP